MSIKVGIDFHVFDGKFQGSRTHLLSILQRLFKLSGDFIFFVFLENTEKLAEEYPVFLRPNVNLVKMNSSGSSARLLYQLPMLQKNMVLIYSTPIYKPCDKSVILRNDYP
jgi:hypothetical protein